MEFVPLEYDFLGSCIKRTVGIEEHEDLSPGVGWIRGIRWRRVNGWGMRANWKLLRSDSQVVIKKIRCQSPIKIQLKLEDDFPSLVWEISLEKVLVVDDLERLQPCRQLQPWREGAWKAQKPLRAIAPVWCVTAKLGATGGWGAVQ